MPEFIEKAKEYLKGTKVKPLESFSVSGDVVDDEKGSRLELKTSIVSSIDFPGDTLENLIALGLNAANLPKPSEPSNS